MINYWLRVRDQGRSEQGVFAILTLAFFIACGLACILIVWGIAQASGIYNAAYFATQSAATSAIGTAEVNTSEGDANKEGFRLSCGTTEPSISNNYECQDQSAPIYKSVQKSLDTSLTPSTPGTFGLVGPTQSNAGDKVRLEIGSLQLYNITPQNGAQARARDCTPNNPAANDGGPLTGVSPTVLGCWSTTERGVQIFPTQYQTGLVLRTNAFLRLPNGCASSTAFLFCFQLSINATGSASVVTTQAPLNYESYSCYGRQRDSQDYYFKDPNGFLSDCRYDAF